MLSPVKLVTGATVAALSATLLLAGHFTTQDDSGPAAPAAEQATSGVTLVTGEVAVTSQDYAGDTEAHDWGYVITDSLETAEFSMTDERLSGTARLRGNAHANDWELVWSTSVYLQNDQGSWVGSGHGYIDPPSTGGELAAGTHVMLVLEGQGDYEGLTAILDLDSADSASPIEVTGAITAIGLPETPAAAPTDFEAEAD